MRQLICIDFDGVLRIDDEPADYVFEALNHLRAGGYQIIVLTARNTKEVENWLRNYGFPEFIVTNVKPPGACAYIDDRAVKFTNWRDIAKKF